MDLSFDQYHRSLWPASLLLGLGRKRLSFDHVLKLILNSMRQRRFRSDESVPPGWLKGPATAEHVLGWLDDVWKRLESGDQKDLSGTRRSIVMEIVESPLSAEDQSRLITAVDYLFRLCAARKIARTSVATDPLRIPLTRSPAMQAAYQKLAGMAATELPIWLIGEKGTELEWLGRLIHQMRGLPGHTFQVWDDEKEWAAAISELEGELGSDATLFIRRIDESPEIFQRMLHRRLVAELCRPPSFRIVACSLPVDPNKGIPIGMTPELFSFLSPTRVEIPALRYRIEDLPELIRFFSETRGLEDPMKRFSPEVMKAMESHHWPGNVAELEITLSFALGKRPSGMIRPEDLPDTARPGHGPPNHLLVALEDILMDERFRVLQSEDGRRRLAAFLSDPGVEKFGAGDVQRVMDLGRETVRRLLRALEAKGLIEGIKGSGGKRVTRYRVVR